MQSCGVRRPSVCLSVCKRFVQIASSTRQMAGSRPNLHTMVPRRACIQDVLKVKVEIKGHVIRTLLWFHENRFFSQANAAGTLPNLHTMVPSPACIQGVLNSRSRSKVTFCLYMRSLYAASLHSPSSISIRQLNLMSKSWNELLRHWRSSSYHTDRRFQYIFQGNWVCTFHAPSPL